MIPVVVRRWAEIDVENAKAWYAREDERRGVRFVQEFAATVDRIATLPDRFAEVSTGVRRALLHHFPYAIYFVRREDVSVVIAVLHQHRRPGSWKARLKLEEAG
jgi:plasmid stabilization system protein ParE